MTYTALKWVKVLLNICLSWESYNSFFYTIFHWEQEYLSTNQVSRHPNQSNTLPATLNFCKPWLDSIATGKLKLIGQKCERFHLIKWRGKKFRGVLLRRAWKRCSCHKQCLLVIRSAIFASPKVEKTSIGTAWRICIISLLICRSLQHKVRAEHPEQTMERL